jgi:hypothetical protein
MSPEDADEAEFNAKDAFRAQIESAAAAGWDDPAMDVYNELDPRQVKRTMITAHDLLARLRRRPFEGFRLYLTDGRSFDILYPELNMVGTTWFSIGVPEPGKLDPFAEHFVDVDLSMICKVESLTAPAGVG